MTPPPLAQPLGVISKIRQCCALPHTYIYYVPKFQVPISNGVGGAILTPYPLSTPYPTPPPPQAPSDHHVFNKKTCC